MQVSRLRLKPVAIEGSEHTARWMGAPAALLADTETTAALKSDGTLVAGCKPFGTECPRRRHGLESVVLPPSIVSRRPPTTIVGHGRDVIHDNVRLSVSV